MRWKRRRGDEEDEEFGPDDPDQRLQHLGVNDDDRDKYDEDDDEGAGGGNDVELKVGFLYLYFRNAPLCDALIPRVPATSRFFIAFEIDTHYYCCHGVISFSYSTLSASSTLRLREIRKEMIEYDEAWLRRQCGGPGGGALGYLGGCIRSLSKFKNTPKALISGQKSTLILIKR